MDVLRLGDADRELARRTWPPSSKSRPAASTTRTSFASSREMPADVQDEQALELYLALGGEESEVRFFVWDAAIRSPA